jgi:hypothetical protein
MTDKIPSLFALIDIGQSSFQALHRQNRNKKAFLTNCLTRLVKIASPSKASAFGKRKNVAKINVFSA